MNNNTPKVTQCVPCVRNDSASLAAIVSAVKINDNMGRSPCIFLFLFLLHHSLSSPLIYDIIIYGSTPAGISSSISAAKHNLNQKILLLSSTSFIGGMAVGGGIGFSDIGNESIIVNTTMWVWGWENSKYYNVDYPVYQADMWLMDKTGHSLLAQYPNIDVIMNSPLKSVVKNGTVISQIITTNGTSYEAAVFVDASYEGDLLIGSKVSFTWGRESIQQYNESLAGVRPISSFGNFQFPVLATESENSSELIKFVDPTPLAGVGEADGRLMGFTYRLCLTQNSKLKAPFFAPNNYNRTDFLLLQRYIQTLIENNEYPKGIPFDHFNSVGGFRKYPPGDKYCICDTMSSGFSSDDAQDVLNYVTASYEEREAISEKVKYYVLGQMYYLANDDEVPEFTRNQANSYGLCNDEWVETQNVPPQMYVREGARMIGEKVMTQNEIMGGLKRDDSIALGSWNFDIHVMSVTPVLNNNDNHYYVNNEGAMFESIPGVHGSNTYEIPVSILLPKITEATNLVVPVCNSASHIAYSSIRIESTFQALGEASGILASEAASQKMSVQNVNVSIIQNALSSRGILYHV